jgi:hypothetical protein
MASIGAFAECLGEKTGNALRNVPDWQTQPLGFRGAQIPEFRPRPPAGPTLAIKRWSGHDNDVPKFTYIDSEERARALYAKLRKDMRQGMIELFDGDGKSVKRDWAPRLRR